MILTTSLPMLLALASTAEAQQADGTASQGDTPSLNAQLFRPAIDGRHSMWLNDGKVGADGQLTGRFLLQYVNDPLVWRDGTGGETPVVSDVFQLDLMGGYTMGPVRVGLDLPLYLRSTGQEGGETGLGDVALDLKGAILSDDDAPIGLGLGTRVAFPTSTVATSLGSGGLSADLAVYAHRGIGKTTLLANLGTRFRPETAMENLVMDDQLFYGLGLGYAATDDLGLSAELVGHASYGAVSNSAGNPLELLPGASYRPGGGDVVVRAAVGLPLNSGIGAPDSRVLLALAVEPPAKGDRDGDGILDRQDTCPDQAEDDDRYMDDDGCPDLTEVSLTFVDGEGRTVAGVLSNINGEEAHGERRVLLPMGEVEVFASAPGFSDLSTTIKVPGGPPTTMEVPMADAPGTLVIKVVGPDGKPLNARVHVKGKDYDLAGPLELARQPGVIRVDISAPGYLSRRIPAEIRAGERTELFVDLQKALAEVTAERIEIKDSVYFETAKAVIKSESFNLLDQVATIMKDNPEITGLRIEGHTDSRGNDAYNLKLSKERAAAVLEYLVERGVDRDRLESEGFGETQPLDTRQNETAWAKNRRVDFFISARSGSEAGSSTE